MTTHGTPHHRRMLATLAAALSVGLLAACTPSSQSGPTATPAQAFGLPSGVRQATSVPSDVPNMPALRRNVAIDTCASSDGGWKAVGTAKNPTKADVTYTISIFFTTDKGTVIGTGKTKVAVSAGATRDWTVSSRLTPAPDTRCILRGVG